MPPTIASSVYGKSAVRLTKVTRHADRHDLKELSVDVRLVGEAFEETYLTGDNRHVIATDSMKNTVYVLAKSHPLDSIESFAIALAEHFTHKYAQVVQALVDIREDRWHRIRVSGREHPHAFLAGSGEKRGCSVLGDRLGVRVGGQLHDLVVLKTTDSAFRGFVRDEFTTLPDADDRIFATSITARWNYEPPSADFNPCVQRLRQALLETFAEHKSLSVQQTLYAMGQAALAACPEIDDLQLTLPNKHRIPVNLAPFGLENRNEVFVPTDEPHGTISATLTRD